jgi:hypothetical protein
MDFLAIKGLVDSTSVLAGTKAENSKSGALGTQDISFIANLNLSVAARVILSLVISILIPVNMATFSSLPAATAVCETE